MLTFEREITELREAGALGNETAAALLRRERREIFSIYPEVRALGWLGATLIAAGIGIVLSRNLDRLGPIVVSLALALAAIGCYVGVGWRRRTRPASVVDESVLLLGGLLLSAAVGYFERNYGILGDHWQRHFLLLSVAHGMAAYAFHSRTLLTLSITSLAAYFGLEKVQWVLGNTSTDMSVRAFILAAIVLLWMLVDGMRPARSRAESDFEPVFQHFSANLALWGALALTFHEGSRIFGAALTVVFAAFVIWWGFRQKTESFVIYAYIYAVIAVDIAVCSWLQGNVSVSLYLVVSTIAAIVGLFAIHGRFRKDDA